jgi:hypothetical protein
MAKIIVVTGLDQLPPAERWPRLIAPLAEELADSGLGELPDLETLRRDADNRGSLEADEVAVQLVHFNYGRPLVDRVVEAAGVKPRRQVIPARWQEYGCADYFASELAERGYLDEAAQYWLIEPTERIYEEPDLRFLAIGGPGMDGIRWGYRLGESGVWAYPIDGEFVRLAATAEALLQGWNAGTITF